MNNRAAVLRAIAAIACLLTLAAACASNGDTARSSTTTASPGAATNPNETPNSIPFNVGERVGLPNGWRVQIVKVHRPFPTRGLPAPAAGRQYVALDLSVANQGTTTEAVNAAKLFSLGDSTGKEDHVVAIPGRPNGLDGSYAANTNRSGRLVFDVPVHAQLRMAMDGPLIGTQRAIFMVDPPNFGPGD
jgi:hypothetical protein